MGAPQRTGNRQAARESPAGQVSGPELLQWGEGTARAVAQIMPTARPITVPSALGDVELRPGAIWSGERMLVYPTWMSCYYTIGHGLYVWYTTLFVRDEWFHALSRGATRAMPMVYLAQAEMALLQGIFVPWYLLLGLGVAKLGLFYHNHRIQVDRAVEQAPPVLRMLNEFRRRYPMLFNKLALTAARDVVTSLPEGVTGQDVGFFIGRVIRGIGGLPEVTLGAVLRVVTRVAVIVAGTHLPSVAAHGVAQAASRSVAALRAELAQQGISVSDEEAQAILHELLAHNDTVANLQEVERALHELIPVLEQLKSIIHAAP